jgi:hypothetical protein
LVHHSSIAAVQLNELSLLVCAALEYVLNPSVAVASQLFVPVTLVMVTVGAERMDTLKYTVDKAIPSVKRGTARTIKSLLVKYRWHLANVVP